MCVFVSVLARVGWDDAGEVLLGSGSQGKHLVFIRHDQEREAGRWWRGLNTIGKAHSLRHPAQLPQPQP